MKSIIGALILIFLLAGCTERDQLTQKSELELAMNEVAEKYVKLVLQIGSYKPDYVDAYYGPEEWKPKNTSAEIDSAAIADLIANTDALLNQLDDLGSSLATEMEKSRYKFLYKQLLSVKAILYIIVGGELSFDQEVKVLYDIDAPTYDKEFLSEKLSQLESILPGKGDIQKRVNDFKTKFIIPKNKLDTVFTVAIMECKKITKQYIELPENENFSVEYVNNQPWGAYNWYKGNNRSVIQVNTDLPIYIDRAIDLAAHEGYPGHHVFNSLLEENMVKQNGWVEFSVYPLFSPVSLIAEGTAEYGKRMVFPRDKKIEFEKTILFPLVGLDSSQVELYYDVLALLNELDKCEIEVARNYIDGKWSREQAVQYLIKYSLVPKDKAEKKIDFIKKYRSYIVNYSQGEELVESYIKNLSGSGDDVKIWQVYSELLSTPHVPSDLN